MNTNSQIIFKGKMVQYRTVTIYIILIVLLFLQFIPFLGGKHNCLHAKSRYKIGKSTLIIILIKGKGSRLWRELNTFPSISSFTDRVFSIFRQEKIRVRSVGNGHQIGFSRADTLNKNINKRLKIFSYRE